MRVTNITLTAFLALACSNSYAHTSQASAAAHTVEHFSIVAVLGLVLGVLCAMCRRART